VILPIGSHLRGSIARKLTRIPTSFGVTGKMAEASVIISSKLLGSSPPHL